jgi:hydroxymethylbilane synthase
MTAVRVATRGSRLALAQTRLVIQRLMAANPRLDVEIVEVSTAGDRDQVTPLSSGEGAGWFTSALQEALLRGDADIAVHSYKDLPTSRPDGLVLAAVPLREDPRDALVSVRYRALKGLPPGAVVGTSSPRRRVQLLAIRPDLEIREIRGNVDTRVAKVDGGDYDAVVLALAGLRRLGLESHAREVLGLYDVLPAPAQGALAVECRAGDQTSQRVAASIDDPLLRQAVAAERSFLGQIGAGCSFPAAAYAEHFGTTLKLHGLIAVDDRIVRSKIGGAAETAAGLGRQLATELMALAGMASG